MELDPRALCGVALELSFRAVRSDGSVRHVTHGAFGWVLSSHSGERLAYWMGPPIGQRLMRLLSLSMFLIRLKRVLEYA